MYDIRASDTAFRVGPVDHPYNLRTKVRLANRFAILIMALPNVYYDAADMRKLAWPTYNTNEAPTLRT